MMKTRSLSILLIAAVVIAAVVVFVALLLSNERMLIRSPVLNQQPSIITWMEGRVEISPESGDRAVWTAAEIGMRVREGDSIRTGADSSADIRIHKDGVIRIGAETLVVLDELTLRHQTVNITKGLLFAQFHLLFDSQELQFTTPHSVAAVRGTELVFTVDGARTRIDALSGITEVSNPDFPEQKILLAFQSSSTVESGRAPTEPVEMSTAEVVRSRRVFNGINHEEVFLISQDILFRADSAEILPESVSALDEVARKLALHREKILIAGHTADVGAASGQVRLSEERADAIRTALIDRGISSRRLSTAGYGGSRPVGDNGTAEGRARNRRVEFLVVE